ncbi:nitronate monooxygenase [Sphingomonas lacunae]|uniref:Nitronate monooxygenase n=1 Tax=Sphingomonas lacunae TaxID=2698828 RepID=A0A6M4AUL5_9SPHN|nr:nitronate monooxygenase [Sphingomonas lacunae]QJQ32837.1 nitronate monooxygenase [Sphingomonas lacunae]
MADSVGASLHTRLTRRFDLTTPLALAPMAMGSGGALAAAWAKAGALGLVGGGYGELDWTAREYTLAADALAGDAAATHRLGCGFISWRLEQDASAFDWLLDQPARPAAVMLSFGDPTPWVRRLRDRGIAALCQIQSVAQLQQAVDAGADGIVAQGGEAGGHGARTDGARGTFTLVPELADRLAAVAPETLLLAAGGIADGRGLAAALVLGADGALIGSRAWVTTESLASTGAKAQAVATGGDETARSGIFDILRRKNWPADYGFRAIRNAMHRQWEGREADLRADPEPAIALFEAGVKSADFDRANVTVGEATGLINDVPNSAALVTRMTAEAAALLP